MKPERRAPTCCEICARYRIATRRCQVPRTYGTLRAVLYVYGVYGERKYKAVYMVVAGLYSLEAVLILHFFFIFSTKKTRLSSHTFTQKSVKREYTADGDAP